VRDLSLHLLDVIENSIRAEATVISVTVIADPEADLFTMVVEDNGRGLTVSPETATDPFYTTKSGKRTGLGLALLKAASERAGGRLVIGLGALGGVIVKSEMRLSHVDRSPLGDLVTTLSGVVCTNPDIDFVFRLSEGPRSVEVRSLEVAGDLAPDRRTALGIAQKVAENLRKLPFSI
jgi:hypothetical protein